MTVEQLISELQKCDPGAAVLTEGCDCAGDTAFLERDYFGSGEVYIRRSLTPGTYDNKTILKPLSLATGCGSDGNQG